MHVLSWAVLASANRIGTGKCRRCRSGQETRGTFIFVLERHSPSYLIDGYCMIWPIIAGTMIACWFTTPIGSKIVHILRSRPRLLLKEVRPLQPMSRSSVNLRKMTLQWSSCCHPTQEEIAMETTKHYNYLVEQPLDSFLRRERHHTHTIKWKVTIPLSCRRKPLKSNVV